jgi:hypothetical protein
MGERGPVPKRKAERRRRNKGSDPETVPALTAAVDAPPANEEWHPAATDWYGSLSLSGQAQFYEPSDWEAARLVAGELSAYLRAPKRSAMMFSHLWSAMTDLLTTEGARRRAAIEVERAGDEKTETPAGVVALDEYRTALGAK